MARSGLKSVAQGLLRVEWREDKERMGMVLARKRAVGIQPGFIPVPRPRLEAYAMLGYIACRSVERVVEMLPEGSSARPPLPRDGVSVA